MSVKEPPKKIGRYDVERMLGQGGMGRVWLARDTVLGRRVAVKVLRDDLALPPRVKDELFVRMEHEARAAAAVSHPNIVTFHDMGEDKAVGLYLVFEYVSRSGGAEDEKHSLRERLTSGPLPFAEVAKLARELGSALTFAHEAGVIHRDVKPENILFSRNGFKIADFGIARIPESTITRANTVLGTPAYTAPEALGNGEFGPASDQFALAATLYEAATGRRAFQAEDAIATAGKVSSEPPPPITNFIGEGAVVAGLDAVLQRGLAKAPADRYGSCAELGEEVARVLEASAGTPELTKRVRTAPMLTPIMTLERTPLSSRAASLRAQLDAIPPIPTNSESTLFQRKRTQRFQNVAVALAVMVIVLLVLIGRRNQAPKDDADAGAAPVERDLPVAAPRPHPKPKPSGRPAAIIDAGTTEDSD